MFNKYLLFKDSEGRYLSYDEGAEQEWFFSQSRSKACRFDYFGEFERTYKILKPCVLRGHTDFYVEFMYVAD